MEKKLEELVRIVLNGMIRSGLRSRDIGTDFALDYSDEAWIEKKLGRPISKDEFGTIFDFSKSYIEKHSPYKKHR